MAREYDMFMESEKRWFCHVDDDNYVNVPALVGFLQQYNHSDNWYLGRPSISHPMEVLDRANPGQKLAFWFATGGAGFCISRGLADKMVPHAGGGRIMTTGGIIRLPDDCTVGYIINHLLKVPLTKIKEFHSHLEGLHRIPQHQLSDQLTLSYFNSNVIDVKGYSHEKDPTSLRYKFDEVKELLTDNIVDLLMIAESKLDSTFQDNLFQVEGYKLQRRDRNQYGGGLLTLIKSDFPSSLKQCFESDILENICYEIYINDAK
ncbi:FNG [Mytilus edulis]|uniref:FNG n=1 Tax=Mytilus edulis TaxID=6550 RepID=A0A8S3RQZ0_MYTED|nr:FNG [Mytilus edulis]